MENIEQNDHHGKADTHVHTRYSGFGKYSFLHFPESVTDPHKAVETAYRRKLDVLCITDHNTIQGALIAQKHARDIEVVVGEEISSADGEILGSSDAHSLDMIGNGYTTFEGRTSEEIRKSILKRKTSFGGSKTPLSECISWSREIAIESIKMIYDSLAGKKIQDILYSEIAKTTAKTRALGLIGAALYIGLPLSYFFGISGEIILNMKSKRKWNENTGMLV